VSTVTERAEALKAALSAVDGIRVQTDLTAVTTPPAIILGVPTLEWSGTCAGPTDVTFFAYLVVPFDGRTVERLWGLIEAVGDAVDATDFAVVVSARPGTYPSGGVDLPAYELEIQTNL